MTTPKKSQAEIAYKQILYEFRKKHTPELDKNIDTWIEIRDNKKNSPKDRGEAAKNIQRSLGAMSAEKEAPKKQVTKKEISVLSPKREKQITNGINEILEDFNQEET